jgi:molecular chaperone DnaK (HSP70)
LIVFDFGVEILDISLFSVMNTKLKIKAVDDDQTLIGRNIDEVIFE